MKSSQRGFTLLELMITIAIVGIIATIAIWDSSDLLENDRAESYLQELKRNISFARAKAASSDAIVVVCSGNTSKIEGNETVSCLNDWNQGSLFVFFDSDQDGIYKPSANDIILRVMEEIPDNSKLAFSGGNSLVFDTSGMLRTVQGKFTYCPAINNNDNNKQLEISTSGTTFYRGNTTDSCN